MTNEKILQEFNNRKNLHLFLSIGLDILGMSTYLIPVLGEVGDVLFAPFYGLAIFAMYKMRVFSATIGSAIGVVEELLPGFDVIPTATSMWVYTYQMRKDSTLKRFIKEKNKELATLDKLKG